ncbi:bifunctional diguanylate cyclase/phosphodiesterase [Phenylobacterium sp. LjRoot225]|uniref:putative bifunctional diguanylate cyclase/phosphodiesterase n=1 Tax=Phenylobacterium sp. LjRoot225 TaxID=3342285 RepID=UPI003ECDAD28
MSDGGWIWDVSTTLAALGAGEAALWAWSPDDDRLQLAGAARALGLGPLVPDCSSAAFRALVLPQDRNQADELLEPRAPGAEVVARIRMRGAEPCVWRGRWLEGGRATGVLAPQTRFAAADHDSLTGLLDRRSFIRCARERLQAPGQHQLVVADLDRLRRLNEALGHERADLVLAALGARLAAALSPKAIVARIGEDEFAALFPAATGPGVEHLRRELERPMRVAGFDIHPKMSLGVVEVRGGPDAPEATELLRRVELKVEAGKAGFRRLGPPLEGDGLSRLALEADLKGAIERGELGPFYQPIVRLGTGALAGFEALVRWRHPRRGLLTPEHFLPLCEELGMMGELGVMMRREAAAQLGAWRRLRPAAAGLTVAVNLSVGELDRPDLLAEACDLRRSADLPPGALKLEVTEGDVMRDPERAAVTLHNLRAAGVTLALDDFGVGFSSLSYLTRLPFDTLKIDGYFVRTMTADPGSAKIVSSIIKLGQDLALEVVAEGVEDAATALRLQALGCDYGQGFSFSQALSPGDALAYIEACDVEGRPARKAG